jgi:phosphate transport system permease protein
LVNKAMKYLRFKRRLQERIFQVLMIASFTLVAGSLVLILWTILSRGLPAMTWEVISQTPQGGFYLGKSGGILNAIVGSLYLAGGGTLLALIFSFPLAIYIESYLKVSRWGNAVRIALDVLWGIPSIVYGAFGFTIMLAMGMRASLLGGIVVLALLELPIMTRAMDEVIRRIPDELEQAAFAVGSTRLELATRIIPRQILPGLVSAALLAFGRGIGDAASVLFTAGYTDNLPTSLLRPAASLPLAIFFQLSTPYPEVQQRAYASALILTVIVLVISISAHILTHRVNKYIIK